MSLTEFQIEFKETLLKITDNIDTIYAYYLQARTDEVRQEIIDGINNGQIKNVQDILTITIKQAPTYDYLVKSGLISEILKDYK